MAAKGYTSAALVGEELGKTLSAGQQTQATGLIEEAEALIDRKTKRAWLSTSPVTNESHVVQGDVVYLKKRNVATVTSVQVRSRDIGATWTTLVSGSSYELLDATNGILSLGGAYVGDYVRVSYTFTSPETPPADIRRAATMLVAQWMVPRLNADSYGLKRYSVGDELDITFKDDGSRPIPEPVADILAGYGTVVFA